MHMDMIWLQLLILWYYVVRTAVNLIHLLLLTSSPYPPHKSTTHKSHGHHVHVVDSECLLVVVIAMMWAAPHTGHTRQDTR